MGGPLRRAKGRRFARARARQLPACAAMPSRAYFRGHLARGGVSTLLLSGARFALPPQEPLPPQEEPLLPQEEPLLPQPRLLPLPAAGCAPAVSPCDNQPERVRPAGGAEKGAPYSQPLSARLLLCRTRLLRAAGARCPPLKWRYQGRSLAHRPSTSQPRPAARAGPARARYAREVTREKGTVLARNLIVHDAKLHPAPFGGCLCRRAHRAFAARASAAERKEPGRLQGDLHAVGAVRLCLR